MIRTTSLLAALAVGFVLGAASPHAVAADAAADSKRSSDPVADLRAALDGYDHRAEGEITNTIPIEQSVLRAVDEAKPESVVEFTKHERFGALLFVALCEKRPTGAVAAKLVETFRAFDETRRLEAARALAALGTDAARGALRELAAVDAFLASGPPRDAIRAALVRAGDASAVAEVKAGLASKDADAVATALVLAGDAAATEFLADAARFADDARKLATPGTSRWSDTKETVSDDGNTRTSTTVPVPLATVGDAAVEASNRMFVSALPEWVAWWYELEKGPRFGRGADAVVRVRRFVAEDAKAAKAKAPGAAAAVAATLRALRAKAGEGAGATLVSVTFDKAWTVAYQLNGAAGTAIVDATGKATLR